MDNLTTPLITQLLGVSTPWHIQGWNCDPLHREITVRVGQADSKPQPLPISEGETKKPYRWQHMNIMGYRCFITVNRELNLIPDSQPLYDFSIESYLGTPRSLCTNHLRQQISLLLAQGKEVDDIMNLLDVEKRTIDSIRQDNKQLPELLHRLPVIPTTRDRIWLDLLTEKKSIKTSQHELKLLLSRLKVQVINRPNAETVNKATALLQRYFINHYNILEQEIDAICRIGNHSAGSDTDQNTAKNIDIELPPTRSEIWSDILTGKIKIQSENMSLNLFLIRQCSAFRNSRDHQQKIKAIWNLREFFKKNGQSLVKELHNTQIIKKPLASATKSAPTPSAVPEKVVVESADESSPFKLPDADHAIWQRIILDQHFMPSKHRAYNSLLKRLRSALSQNYETTAQIAAAKHVRDFIANHPQTVDPKIKVILSQLAA